MINAGFAPFKNLQLFMKIEFHLISKNNSSLSISLTHEFR